MRENPEHPEEVGAVQESGHDRDDVPAGMREEAGIGGEPLDADVCFHGSGAVQSTEVWETGPFIQRMMQGFTLGLALGVPPMSPPVKNVFPAWTEGTLRDQRDQRDPNQFRFYRVISPQKTRMRAGFPVCSWQRRPQVKALFEGFPEEVQPALILIFCDRVRKIKRQHPTRIAHVDGSGIGEMAMND